MEVVRRIEDLPKDEKDKPLEPVTIANCGELPPLEKEKEGGGDAN